MKHKITFVIAFQLLFSTVFSQNDTSTIVIMHTNDMHGYINKFAKMKPVIDSVRNANKNSMLVSAGDLFSGNPYVDRYKEPGYPIIDLMNILDYKISALGNHEFDYGQAVLQKRRNEAKFTIICSNIETQNSEIEKIIPYKIIKIGETKIAFISGLKITEEGYPETLKSNLTGIKFTDPIKTISEYKYLKDSASIVIGLTHLGYKADQVLAEKTNFIDAIIGGHSHTIIDTPCVINNTLICQAGSYNNYLGVLTIKILNNKIVYKKDTLINISNRQKTDVNIRQVVDKYYINSDLDRIVGFLGKTLIGQEEIVDIFLDAFRITTNSEISFMNYGGIRIDTLKKGNVKALDIYSVDPFNNDLMTAMLSVDEIISLIKVTYSSEKKKTITGSIKYEVELKKDGSIGSIIFDKVLDNNKLYKVVLNSYTVKSYNFKGNSKFKNANLKSNDALIKFFRDKK